MPSWDHDYLTSLVTEFAKTVNRLDTSFETAVNGGKSSTLEDLSIGSTKMSRAAVLTFDICDFSARISNPEPAALKKSLLTIDSVISLIMRIVHDHGGHVEKGAGDGIMAIFGADKPDQYAVNVALDAATTIFYTIKNIVNPFLRQVGIPQVDGKIGIDHGPLLITRNGLNDRSAKYTRRFLTTIGPAAYLSSQLEQSAGINEIWVGDIVKKNAKLYRQNYFFKVTPRGWLWHYTDDPRIIYDIWRYSAEKPDPS